jgi:paxillin
VAAGGRGQQPSARGAPKAAVGGDSDLDSILDGLDEPSKAAPAPASRGPQKPPEAALPKGVCSGCRKPVTGEAIHALGRSYHPDHFMCSTCGKAIGTGSFYEKEGQPQCDRCYQSVFCKRCANCNLPITNQLVTALGQPWHPKCFVCTGCRGPFPGGSFFERDGRPYCSNCYSNVFTASCRRCGDPVNENVINALGSTWHDFHFSCETCGVTFPDGQFWELDGNPYCESHYREQLGEY